MWKNLRTHLFLEWHTDKLLVSRVKLQPGARGELFSVHCEKLQRKSVRRSVLRVEARVVRYFVPKISYMPS